MSKHRSLTLATLAVTALALAAAGPAWAQGGLGDRLKKKAKESAERAVERRTEQRAGQATDAALDKAENAVKCAATDRACQDKAKKEGKPVQLVDAQGNPVAGGTAQPAAGAGASAATPAGGAAAAATARPNEGAWANYDFKPGDRILVADDFSRDEVGDFPRRFEFKSGNMEIVTWNGGRWLRGQGGEFFITLPEVLPNRFTMEFDLAGSGNAMSISFEGDKRRSDHEVEFGGHFARLRSGEVDANGDLPVKTDEHPIHVAITIDGTYLKAYANERRVLNVPNADLGRSNKIYINLNGWSAEAPRMIANLRIAAGGKKLYDALSTTGRVATQGIYFDVGSDRIRPESSPTLKEIANMLTEHADLRLTIEGHTDNVGQPATNQTLSERRAAAVREALVSQYGVDGSRLVSKGLGSTKPAGSNDTPEGRQQNRRVELVKM